MGQFILTLLDAHEKPGPRTQSESVEAERLGECLEYLKEIVSYCNSAFASWSEYVTTHTQASYLEEMFVYFVCINVIAQ